MADTLHILVAVKRNRIVRNVLVDLATGRVRPNGGVGPQILDIDGFIARVEPYFEKSGFYEKEIARRTEHLRRELGLKGRPIGRERFHVSLHGIGEYELATEESFSFPLRTKDYRLWVEEVMPVFLILYDAVLEEAYWLHVQAYDRDGNVSVATYPKPVRAAR